MPMELFFSQYTDKGGRANNEDSVGISEWMTVVADGLGGHADGEVASRACVEYLLGRNLPDVPDNAAMHRLIEEVNAAVWQTKDAAKAPSNMATTVVAAFVKDGMFNYFNVGDSRLYFFRNHKLFFRSKDHSVTQACVNMGTITEAQMRFHEDRNKLTKVLGIDRNLKLNQDFQPFPLLAGDAYLLCTDGFWEYVWEKEMEKGLKKAHTPQEWLAFMLKKLQKRVPENCDNQSAVCVFVA